MADESVLTELNFEVTGGGLTDLQRLATLLGSVDKVAGNLSQSLSTSSRRFNSQAKAIRNAAAAYDQYITAQSKASTVTAAGVGGGAGAAAVNPKADSADAALQIQAISNERALALEAANNVKLEAVAKASADRKKAILAASEAEQLTIRQGANLKTIALERAETAETLAVRKAQIDRDLALVISAQNREMAIIRANAAAKIKLVTTTGEVAVAKVNAAEELAIVQANNAAKLASDQATENARLAVAAAGAAKRKSVAAAEGLDSPERMVANLSNTRYALYDVSRTAGLAAAALGAVFLVPQVMSGRYTQQFNSVIRTTGALGDQVNTLKDEFIDLSTNIPEKFSALADIGTIAGQLDIAADAAANFTENIAMFSATTGVSVEEAATNIGRLAQLTGTSSSEFDNLSAAIYQAGVTSVATEGEILELGSQIATAGDLAGFSNVQIVALSAALASLGIQPEAARGSLQRIFNTIQNGADSSGAATQRLAEIAGMTVDQMQSLWNQGESGSQEFFTAFTSGLGRMADAGVNTTNVLKDLGIYQVRDQRLLQVLANNMDVYTQAINESTQAYIDGTAMTDAYDKQTDNLIDNFERFTNTISALLSELGNDQALNDFVKLVTEGAKSLLAFARTDAGKTLATLTITVAGLGATIATIVTVGALARGAMYGMMTAAQGVRGSFSVASVASGTLMRQLLQTSSAFVRGNLTAERSAQILNGTQKTIQSSTVGMTRLEAAQSRVSSGFLRMGSAARTAGTMIAGVGKQVVWIAAISAALWAANAAWEAFNNTAENRAKNAFEGADLGFGDALKSDLQIMKETGESIRTLEGTVTSQTRVVPPWARAIDSAADANGRLSDALATTEERTNSVTLAIGENTAAAMRNAILSNDQFIESWTQVAETFSNDPTFMAEYFERVVNDTDQGEKWLLTRLQSLRDARTKILSSQVDGMGNLTPLSSEQTQQLAQLETQIGFLEELADKSRGLGLELRKASTQLQLTDLFNTATGIRQVGDEAEEATDAVGGFSKRISDILGAAQAPYTLINGWQDLGQAIAENGKNFDGFGEKAQNNVNAVIGLVQNLKSAAGGDEMLFGEGLLGTMVMLQQQGIETGGALSFMGDILQSTLGSQYDLNFNSGPAQKSMIAVIDTAIALQRQLLQTQAAALMSTQSYSAAIALSADYTRTQNQLKGLEALRTSALNTANRAQNAYNTGIKKGTDNLNKNSKASKGNSAQTKKTARTYADWAKELQGVIDRMDDLRFGTQDSWRDIESAQEDAVKAILNDLYALDAAYTKLFSGQGQTDKLLGVFYQVQEDAEDAAEAVRRAAQSILDAQADLADINSERSKNEYWLQVAIDYGDLLRVQEIRARLVELDAKEAKAQSDLASAHKDVQNAQDAQNKSLTGSTKQAIKNRGIVKDLLSVYTDYISELIDSGSTQSDVTKAVSESRKDFMQQAEALGFNAAELQTYAKVFDSYAGSSKASSNSAEAAVRDLYEAWQDYILQLASSGASQKTINAAIAAGKKEVGDFARSAGLAASKVNEYKRSFDGIQKIFNEIPSKVTVKFDTNVDAATAALKEFQARIDSTKGSADKLGSALKGLGGNTNIGLTLPSDSKIKKAAAYAEFIAAQRSYLYFMNHGGDAPTSANLAKAKKLKDTMNAAKKRYESYATGGFTGVGPKYEEAGTVHRGEFVFPREAVNQSTGQPYLMEAVMKGTPLTSQKFPSVIMVELSPVDRALLKNSGASLTVTLDGKTLAKAVNSSNKVSNIRGTG